MAKSQKKSNREIRKPKQKKVTPAAAPSAFLATAERNAGAMSGHKRQGK
jgi:hypothetical protein